MKEKRNIIKKSPEFYLITLFFTGITGYIFLGTCNGLSTSQAMIHPAILVIFCEICGIFWIVYSIYLQLKNKLFNKKSFILCFIIIPSIVFSMIGQLGNCEALKVLLGNNISQIYYCSFIVTYCLSLFLLIKKQQ